MLPAVRAWALGLVAAVMLHGVLVVGQFPAFVGPSQSIVTASAPFTLFAVIPFPHCLGDINLILSDSDAGGGKFVDSTQTISPRPNCFDPSSSGTVSFVVTPPTITSDTHFEVDVVYYRPVPEGQAEAWLVFTTTGDLSPASAEGSDVAAPTINPSLAATPVTTTTAPVVGAAPGTASSTASVSTTSTSGSDASLSTGAKVGIAVGAAALVLLVMLLALFVWNVYKKRRRRNVRPAEYVRNAERTPDRGLPPIEKEIIGGSYGGPFHHTDTGFSDASSTGAVGGTMGQAHDPQMDPPLLPAGVGGTAGLMTQQYPQPSAEPHGDSTYVQAQPPASSRHVSATPQNWQPLQEPGMSDEELARLEDEERRLDEAIAEAERRRGSDSQHL